MADFSTWSRENLEKIANEMLAAMIRDRRNETELLECLLERSDLAQSEKSRCFITECRWFYEDQLDDLPRPLGEEEYVRMFESSRVIDGVRMFPAVVVGSEICFVMGYDDEICQSR